MNQGTQLLTQFGTNLANLAIPLAVLGVIIIGLLLIATPYAREQSQQARDSLKWVLLGVVLVTIASGVVGLTSLVTGH